MGLETGHAAETDMVCDNYQQEMNFRIDVWEYPVGAITSPIVQAFSRGKISHKERELQPA